MFVIFSYNISLCYKAAINSKMKLRALTHMMCKDNKIE